jgi:hypothetical protein
VKRALPIAALALVLGACGDDDATTTTAAITTTAPASTTTQAVTTTTRSVTTSSNGFVGPTNCTEIWLEDDVQAIAGSEYEFLAPNADLTACTYLGEAGGIALAWRVSTLDEFGLSREGASGASEVVDLEVCDDAFYTEIAGPVVIMEVYSADQGRAYNATISGAPSIDAVEWATELLSGVC